MRTKDPTVIAEFKRRRSRQLVASGLALLMAVPVMFGGPGHSPAGGLPETTAVSVAVTVVAMAALYSLVNWRCPACSRYLGRAINPGYCSGCGVQLRE